MSAIGDGRPYFFLSYLHTPKFVDKDDTDPDFWAVRLYKDLCDHLFQISSLPMTGSLGFMDRDLRPGNEWAVEVSNALADCRVFVPLYSPRYFSSEHCGREWCAFARRATAQTERNAQRAPGIIPALWVPVRPEKLPETARTIHYLAGEYNGAYATHGLYRLMRMSRYRDEYEEAVAELARQICEVAENSPVAPGPVADYGSLVNAFRLDGKKTREPRWLAADGPGRSDGRPSPAAWNVPARNASFTGRERVLDRLRGQLLGNERAGVLPVVLTGGAGVGKTQIAVEYANRHAADYEVVWWVPAGQRDLINPAFAELAVHLGVRVSGSIAETAQAVLGALRNGRPYSRWLLVFDNAHDPAELAPFLPEGPGQVLITSSDPAWSQAAAPVAVDVFVRTESVEYLQRRVASLTEADADLVAEVLGDLPFAVEHASAWLAETTMTAAGYVASIEAEFAAAGSAGALPDYPPSVTAVLRLSFDRLRERSPAAARLLELCAYFAADPISLSLIYGDEAVDALLPFDPRLRERTVVGQLVRDISRHALAKVDRGSNSIQVHRLVQEAIRAQMQPLQYREDTMHHVHEILVGARPTQGDIDDPENWSRYDTIWPHLGSSEAYRCDSAATRDLLIDRVRYLWKRGDLNAALEVGERLHEQWTQTIGPRDKQTLYLRIHIANVLRSQGRFKAAHDLDSEVLLAQQAVLGADHPHSLQTAGSLGADLRALGRFREALELDERTYAQLGDTLGIDHPSTLSLANNLAVDLRLVGDCFRACDIDLETLSQRERVLGADHPNTLHSSSMLARDLREVGELKWSVELLRDTHQRYRAVFGDDFVDTLRTAKNLAVSLRKMGRYDEAYELTNDASKRFERNYGSDHPEALACRLNLACDQSARGDKRGAYELAIQVRQAYQATLGDSHPFTLAAASNIATYLRGVDAVEEALELADRTLYGLIRVLGEDHPASLSGAVNKANCLYDRGQLEPAEGLLRETLGLLQKKLGEQHPDALICEGNLAVTLRTQGRADDANQLQRRVVAAMRPVLGAEHPSIAALRAWRLHNRDLEVQPT